jgi:transcriptional regulator with PAS, ATPase and Fis domain
MPERETLMLQAIEELVGPALLLDAQLRVVRATESAEALIGTRIPAGVRAPKILCGEAQERPIAEALSKGLPMTGTVQRPGPEGKLRSITIRATPILDPGGDRSGWILALHEEAASVEAPDAPILFHGMWTRDPTMKRAFHVIERAAARDSAILVRGETGTGKELVARAIHDLSPRRTGPFAAINCAALPPTLLESELFGHVRGAFTGAVRDQPGFFRTANGGTLFLDEVAELPLELQAKLLRVLETRTVIPVGGREPVPVDARIVTATHQSLRKASEEGRFRSDLMYRLRVIPIFLPPLRERIGDIPLLTQRIIEELNTHEGRQISRISPGAMQVLEGYPWPGNVRELRNALEYAYVIGEGDILQPGDLPMELVEPGRSLEDTSSFQVNVPPPVQGEVSPEAERILQALERSGGHRERAAQILGISRVTLWRRMRELGLEG